MANISATWRRMLDAEILQRSSQTVTAIGNQVYVFGGELRPREPRDNDVHVVSLTDRAALQAKPSADPAPSARVGTASTAIGESIYLFSGRGGVAMAPIEEQGAIWKFETTSETWSQLFPSNSSHAVPTPRSYHCTCSDNKDTLYIHAGCPETGRLSDLWSFSVSTKTWKELAPAPGPARGGTSIAFVDGKLYRMNGFDGKNEQGGSVEIYNVDTNTWSSHSYSPDNTSGPAARSVSALLPVTVKGKAYLITLFGESDPSNLGHQGAGKMLRDVWAFEIGTKTWHQVDTQGEEAPDARGWFDADVIGKDTIIVQGGLGEANNRLGDVWRLEFA